MLARMARTTVENTIERIRRQLNSTVRLEINTLGSTLTTTTNPVTLTYDLVNSLRPGAVLSVGRELMRVISINVNSKEVTVIRGWQDTDAQAHDLGDEVLINPRFTRADIYDAIIQEIDTWEPDIFKVTDELFTIAIEAEGVEISNANADAIGVIEVRRNFTEDDSTVWPQFPFMLHRGRSASLTPTSGSGLFVRFTSNTGYAKAAGSVIVRLAVPYDSTLITDESIDLVSVLGMDLSLLELIELGVKARLINDDETGRSARNAQDEPRRNQDVPAGAALQLGQATLQRYERRRNQEVFRLRSKYQFKAW